MTAPADIEALLDRDAIRTVIYTVCRAMDRADHKLFLSGYHEDAWDDHGYYKGPISDFRPASIFRPPHVLSLMHHIGNILIELDGDVAWSESYYFATQRSEENGAPRQASFGGRYYDRLERRNGVWKIASRLAIFDWTRVEDVGETLSFPGAVTGHASREDPTYTRLPTR